MHFPDYDAVEKKFVAFNLHAGDPMVFIVDCKVIYCNMKMFENKLLYHNCKVGVNNICSNDKLLPSQSI